MPLPQWFWNGFTEGLHPLSHIFFVCICTVDALGGKQAQRQHEAVGCLMIKPQGGKRERFASACIVQDILQHKAYSPFISANGAAVVHKPGCVEELSC